MKNTADRARIMQPDRAGRLERFESAPHYTAPARVAHKSAAPTRMLRSSAAPAAAPGGLRGLLTAVLLKLLALLAPSQPLPEPSSRRQRR